jgi:hypothetical protein
LLIFRDRLGFTLYYLGAPQASLAVKKNDSIWGKTMIRTRVLIPGVALAILTLASGNLFAQKAQITVTKPSAFVELANTPPPGLATLFSNLGPQGDLYSDDLGWAVTGPDNSLYGWQNVAMPYTPTADATVQAIQVAFEYYGPGTNGGAVSFMSDIGGLPGKVLKAWSVSNLPKYGTCCRLVTLKDATGINMTAGTQYWIALGTDKGSASADDSWDWTYNALAQGPFAFESGSTNGWAHDSGNLTAFAIYGTVTGDAGR